MTQSLLPHPLSCPVMATSPAPTSNSWKISPLLSALGKERTWVSLMFLPHHPPYCCLGLLSAVGRGDVASPSWHPPHSWRAGRGGGIIPSCDSACLVFMVWPTLTLRSSGTAGPKRCGEGLASMRDVPEMGDLPPPGLPLPFMPHEG